MSRGGETGFGAVVGNVVERRDRAALVAFAEDIQDSLLRAGCPSGLAKRLATMRLVANLLVDRAVAGEPLTPEGGPIARAARLLGFPEPAARAMIGHIALREARTVALPPTEAMSAQLRIATSLAPMSEVSLWLAEQEDAVLPQCAVHVEGEPSPGLVRVVRQAFAAASQTDAMPRRELIAVPLQCDEGKPYGALAARVEPGLAGPATMVLRAAAPLIGLLLEREALLESTVALGDEAASAERALVRFGFDAHDGPAQQIAALQADLRDLKARVSNEFAADPRRKLLIGSLQDFEARADSVAESIRALARSASGVDESVEAALRAELNDLRGSTGIEARFEVSGPVDRATASQRIALLRGVQEALRNAAEHSDAKRVWLRVAASDHHIGAEIRDDGCGFDPERVLSHRPSADHLGLAGIIGRVRLLGGDCEVQSKPGGPTVIKLSLPRWEPQGRATVDGAGIESGDD